MKNKTQLSQTPKAIRLREMRKLKRETKLFLESIGETTKKRKRLPRSKRKQKRKSEKLTLKAYSYKIQKSYSNMKHMSEADFNELCKKYKSWKIETQRQERLAA